MRWRRKLAAPPSRSRLPWQQPRARLRRLIPPQSARLQPLRRPAPCSVVGILRASARSLRPLLRPRGQAPRPRPPGCLDRSLLRQAPARRSRLRPPKPQPHPQPRRAPRPRRGRPAARPQPPARRFPDPAAMDRSQQSPPRQHRVRPRFLPRNAQGARLNHGPRQPPASWLCRSGWPPLCRPLLPQSAPPRHPPRARHHGHPQRRPRRRHQRTARPRQAVPGRATEEGRRLQRRPGGPWSGVRSAPCPCAAAQRRLEPRSATTPRTWAKPGPTQSSARETSTAARGTTGRPARFLSGSRSSAAAPAVIRPWTRSSTRCRRHRRCPPRCRRRCHRRRRRPPRCRRRCWPRCSSCSSRHQPGRS
mmetsp:Transcript_5513/g.23355  ORF Transcript_5513/g.23355 Transcript_5513/m.23355 type:complete len:362 (-) Transcript_5513:820-1905(-)